MMKKKYKRCSVCGIKSKDVKFIIDPYIHDVENKIVYLNFCTECCDERIRDI